MNYINGNCGCVAIGFNVETVQVRRSAYHASCMGGDPLYSTRTSNSKCGTLEDSQASGTRLFVFLAHFGTHRTLAGQTILEMLFPKHLGHHLCHRLIGHHASSDITLGAAHDALRRRVKRRSTVGVL